ncbi:unnamed protein product [Leuciscus chuanchicus]
MSERARPRRSGTYRVLWVSSSGQKSCGDVPELDMLTHSALKSLPHTEQIQADRVQSAFPVLVFLSRVGANVCVASLYSQARCHAQLHLGLFCRPVKPQTGRRKAYIHV